MRRLSKSRVLAGLQCHKRLWWEEHLPPDEQPAADLEARRRMDEGLRVGRVAQAYVPGGLLIGGAWDTSDARVAATREAIARGEPLLYEASFLAGGVLVRADILERRGEGFTLVEVKSSTRPKDEHAEDLAIQAHVLRSSGLAVTRFEVMHLNRECRHPDLSNLFVRADLTARVEDILPRVPRLVAEQQAMLELSIPDVPIGPHCSRPRDCPFRPRCWGAAPPHHIDTINGLIARRKLEFLERGWTTIFDLPDGVDLPATASRQVRSVRLGAPIIEPTLGDTLTALAGPLAYLDFETINPAIPVWPGCRPYDAIPVQFSCHVEQPDGSLRHFAYMVDVPGDPRPEMAHRLVAACAGAERIVTYNMSFERAGVRRLAEAVPELAEELLDVEQRLVDLLPVVKGHVYYPEFGGSFSIKDVLPVLAPGLGYDDLAVRDGGEATVLLARLLLDAAAHSDIERARWRKDLLAYCERDTKAMVELLAALRRLAGPLDPQLHLL